MNLKKLLIFTVITCCGMEQPPTNGLSLDRAGLLGAFLGPDNPCSRYAKRERTRAKFFNKIPDDLKPPIIQYALLNYLRDTPSERFHHFRSLCENTRFYGGIAFDPSGTKDLLTCGSWDGKIGIWDVASGKQKSEFPVLSGDTHLIGKVVYRPDLQELACELWATNNIVLINMETGDRRMVTVPEMSGHLRDFIYDSDGRKLVYACRGEREGHRYHDRIMSCDLTHDNSQHTLMKEFDIRSIPDLHVTPEGLRLDYGDLHGHIWITDITGRVLHDTQKIGGFPPDYEVCSTAYSPAHNLFIVSAQHALMLRSPRMYIVKIAKDENGRDTAHVIQELKGNFGERGPFAVAFNAKATLAAINCRGTVMVYANDRNVLEKHFSGYGPKKPTYSQLFGALMLFRAKSKKPTERLYVSDVVQGMNEKAGFGVTSMLEWREMFYTLPVMERACLVRALGLGINKP